MLGERLRKRGIEVIFADNNVHVKIVKIAVENSNILPIVVVENDTDLLFLLLFCVNCSYSNTYYSPEVKQGGKGIVKGVYDRKITWE